MSSLLSVDEALVRILNEIETLPPETIPLVDALDRVLATDVNAGISLPPFANSSMDGYAVRAADTASAGRANPVALRVVMDIQAGMMPAGTVEAGQAARIMTGAPLPSGADAIVPVEDTDGDWDKAAGAPPPEQVRVFREVAAGAYVRPVGEDIQAGDKVLAAGMVLRPQELGVLAALGQATVSVIQRPRVAILSSGDELVRAEDPLTPGKIRDVNSYTLAGLVQTHGTIPLVLPVARDTADEVRRLFNEALEQQPTMIISSAGVSVGAADLIRDVLQELGEVGFWRINLRPGKPLAFGELGGVPFFGLPGNPVSVMVTFDVLVRPALLKQAGRPAAWPLAQATAGEDMRSDGRRSYLRVRLQYRDGRLLATTTGTQSSGALMSMVLADGLMIVPEGVTAITAGETFAVRLLRPVAEPIET